MGTSRPFYLSELANLILDKRPKTILDIGPGFGKNGFICREYTDIWNHNYTRDTWKTRIDCVEIFEEYITDIHRNVYTNIIIEDAYEYLKRCDKYDLIIATDVVEHFERPRAIEMMNNISRKSNFFYVTIPKNVGNRGGMASNGVSFNEHEAHISGEWSLEQLSVFGNVLLFNNWIWRVSNAR